MLNALTTSYSLTGTATAGDNYSSVSISRITLVGNSLVVYFSATRNSAVEGNITNEIVANVKINHSGKIKEIFNISFANGTTGAVASLQMFNASVSGNYATFDIYLAATGTSTSTLAGYIVIPVTIDLNKY